MMRTMKIGMRPKNLKKSTKMMQKRVKKKKMMKRKKRAKTRTTIQNKTWLWTYQHLLARIFKSPMTFCELKSPVSARPRKRKLSL